MPRLFYLPDTGWWQVPLAGEAGSIYALGEPERGPDNPPPMVEPDHGPMGPMGPVVYPGDEPGELFENDPPYITEPLRSAWHETALAYWRGEIDPLGEGQFNPAAYQSAGACSVPPQHPPPGTLIGLPNAPGSTHDPNVAPNNWQSDNAVDIWLYPGTPVRACAAGTVSRSLGYGYAGPPESRFGAYRLHIEHAGGMVSFYVHLERLTVARGARVRRGQTIGRSGYGACVPHVHFALTYPRDPRAYAAIVYDRNAPPNPPAPPVEPPDEPPPIPARTLDSAWSNVTHAIGPNRRRYRRRLATARRALKDALR